MKTLEQIREAIQGETLESAFPDGRNVSRLVGFFFFPVTEWDAMGFKVTDGTDPATIW